jgi:hypothetical protein
MGQYNGSAKHQWRHGDIISNQWPINVMKAGSVSAVMKMKKMTKSMKKEKYRA